ncbi:uncharacterized protein LOC142177416 [Nicotiana tabacum]|uniref:Uncharacterized protein LOC142177416 n=1 Tax=Nicotiana tabacum TaxID=4097 RepID=A0AC58TXN8_TOBAC
MPIRKLAKCKILLSEFHIVCVTWKAIKGQALADHLAENPMEKDHEPLTMYFLDEEVLFTGEDIAESYPWWRMFFDEAANFKGVGIWVVLIFESGQHYPTSMKIRFPCTNNIAMYEACILRIRIAIDMNIKELLVIGDSDLQRHPNRNYIDSIEIEVQDQHTYCLHVDEEADDKSWYYYIKRFLEPREYLDNATCGQKRALRTIENHFFLNKEFLYRRIPNLCLLRFFLAVRHLGMHVIGPIEHAASNGHHFILVDIEDYTK